MAAVAPTIWIKNAQAAETVVIRSPGGAYDDIRRKLIYEPFEAKTGIRVIPVATTTGKLEAMIRSGHLEIDVIDNDDSVLLQWEDALALLNYNAFKFTDPADILPEYKHTKYVGNFVYADVMGYNLDKWNSTTVPASWAEFWDYKKYPSTRALADMDSGAPNLEFALLADGVPMDKLYPLDLPRRVQVAVAHQAGDREVLVIRCPIGADAFDARSGSELDLEHAHSAGYPEQGAARHQLEPAWRARAGLCGSQEREELRERAKARGLLPQQGSAEQVRCLLE